MSLDTASRLAPREGMKCPVPVQVGTTLHDIVQHSLHRFRPSGRISAHVEKKISEWPVLIAVLNEKRKIKKRK